MASTLCPSRTCSSMRSQTSAPILAQHRRPASVSRASRIDWPRARFLCKPKKAISGQGICKMPTPYCLQRRTTSQSIAGNLAAPASRTFWLRMQSMTATNRRLLPSHSPASPRIRAIFLPRNRSDAIAPSKATITIGRHHKLRASGPLIGVLEEASLCKSSGVDATRSIRAHPRESAADLKAARSARASGLRCRSASSKAACATSARIAAGSAPATSRLWSLSARPCTMRSP